MGSEAEKLTVDHTAQGVAELNELFTKILKDLGAHAIDSAAACTNSVFNLSKEYMSKQAYESLRKFQQLYLKTTAEVDAQKNSINSEVDDIFDAAQANLKAGKEVDANIVEDEDKKRERLGLAGLQKQLEGIITLDKGIRAEIVPAINSIQFEDAVRQRIDHVGRAWNDLLTAIENDPDGDIEPTLRKIGDYLSSQEEKDIFFRLIFNEDAPEGEVDRGVFLEF